MDHTQYVIFSGEVVAFSQETADFYNPEGINQYTKGRKSAAASEEAEAASRTAGRHGKARGQWTSANNDVVERSQLAKQHANDAAGKRSSGDTLGAAESHAAAGFHHGRAAQMHEQMAAHYGDTKAGQKHLKAAEANYKAAAVHATEAAKLFGKSSSQDRMAAGRSASGAALVRGNRTAAKDHEAKAAAIHKLIK